MNTARLIEILIETAKQYRKGPDVVEQQRGDLKVTDVYLMPHISQADKSQTQVDCHFIVVGVNKDLALKYRGEVLQILAEWPKNYYDNDTRLESGPSYITAGAILGDQSLAFLLFAFGEALGFWKVITPKTMGFDGEQADEFAGRGFILIDGFKK